MRARWATASSITARPGANSTTVTNTTRTGASASADRDSPPLGDRLAIDRLGARERAVEGEPLEHLLLRRRGEPPREERIVEQPLDRLRPAARVVVAHQQAVDAVGGEVGNAGEAAADERNPERHRLELRDRQTLLA